MTDPRIETMMLQLLQAEQRTGIAIEALMRIAYSNVKVNPAQLARDAISRIAP